MLLTFGTVEDGKQMIRLGPSMHHVAPSNTFCCRETIHVAEEFRQSIFQILTTFSLFGIVVVIRCLGFVNGRFGEVGVSVMRMVIK